MASLPFRPVALLLCAVGLVPVARAGDQRFALDGLPRITQTSRGIPGDPVNVALVGSQEQLVGALLAAGWQPADPITFKSSVKLVASVALHRPDETAPVSNLYLWKRKEDLAFEQEVGKDASRRHHVRFWQSPQEWSGRPLWLGAATFDTKVGLSHTTGTITHHIDGNVDAERDKLLDDLTTAGRLFFAQRVEGFQQKHEGRNGGGDPYHSDGNLLLGFLGAAGQSRLPRR